MKNNLEIKTYGRIPRSLLAACMKHADKINQVGDETGKGDGYWIYTRAGWWNRESQTHCLHEYTVRDCINAMRYLSKEPEAAQ